MADFTITATPCDGHVLVSTDVSQNDAGLYRGVADGGPWQLLAQIPVWSHDQPIDDNGGYGAAPQNGTTYYYVAILSGSPPQSLSSSTLGNYSHSNQAQAQPLAGLDCGGGNPVPVPTLTATARLTNNVPDILLEGH